jgi:hypothetical protein
MPIAPNIRVHGHVATVTVSVEEWIEATREDRDDLMKRLKSHDEDAAHLVWELAP